MPRKPAQKPEETKTEEKSSRKTKKVADAPAPESKKGGKRSKKTEESAPESTNEPTETTKTVRHVPTRESVEKEFDELVSVLEAEIAQLRTSASKSKGVKFLRTVNKKVKVLRAHALRVSKQRTKTQRNNTNSGFLKPVQISKDLAKFTGWDQSELRSRVDVTKFICNYIKEKDLQDPTDRRNIRVEQDANLKKLLNYDGKDKKPLTYYTLQSYLKSHFTPAPAVEAADAPASVAPSKGKAKGKAKPAVPETVPEEEPVLEEAEAEASTAPAKKASKRKAKAQ